MVLPAIASRWPLLRASSAQVNRERHPKFCTALDFLLIGMHCLGAATECAMLAQSSNSAVARIHILDVLTCAGPQHVRPAGLFLSQCHDGAACVRHRQLSASGTSCTVHRIAPLNLCPARSDSRYPRHPAHAGENSTIHLLASAPGRHLHAMHRSNTCCSLVQSLSANSDCPSQLRSTIERRTRDRSRRSLAAGLTGIPARCATHAPQTCSTYQPSELGEQSR